MRFKSYTRSIATLSFFLLFVAAFANARKAQPDENASPDSKSPVSKLSVSPKSLNFSIKITVVKLSETKHFEIKNNGKLPLRVTVNSPSNPDYVITSGSGTSTIPGKGKLTVDVEFIPDGPGKGVDGSIDIGSDATSGKSSATVELKGSATQKQPTPTATPTATLSPSPSPTPVPGSVTLSGAVRGGIEQVPIAGSIVTIYAAGNAYAAGASALGVATTSSDGDFTLSYNCPQAGSELYLTATGGNAGGGDNTAIGLMAPLGACVSNPSSVVIDELTTIAGEWALAQFSDSMGQTIGVPVSNAIGLVNSMELALTNLAGTASGGPASFFPSAVMCTSSSPPLNCPALEKLNTLANVLAACVSSAGPASNACSTLFSDTGIAPTGTTLGVAHAIAVNPSDNVAGFFAIQEAAGSAPYQPALAATPNDWTLALNYSGGDNGGGLAGPSAVAIDVVGNAWIANASGVVVEMAPDGSLLSGVFGFTGGGLDNSFDIAIDSAGNAWVTNKYSSTTDGTVTELAADGSVLSGSSGYSSGGIDYPLAIAIDTSGSVWVANYANASVTRNPQTASAANFTGGGLSFPTAIALDESGNAWIANFGNDSVTELSSTGVPLSPDGGYIAGGLEGPVAIAVDATDHAWVANFYGDSVTELDSSGAAASGSPFSGGGLSAPSAIAADGIGDVWIANETNSITGLEGSSSAAPGSPFSGTSGYTGGGMSEPTGLAIDPSGNLWVTNFDNNTVTEFLGIAAPVNTPMAGPAVHP